MPRHALACALALACLASPALAGGRMRAESPIAFYLADSERAPDASSRALGRGIVEAPGRLIEVATRFLGLGNFTGTSGPWCADAVSYWLRMTGHRPLASRMAASALAYGPHLAGPKVGALAVLSTRRGYAGHVGVVAGVAGDRVELISGNWSHRVARALVPRAAFAAFIAVE